MAEKLIDEIYALINKYYEGQGNNTKTLVKEDRIHKKDAIETEVVKVKLLAQTDKGLQIVFNGIEDWVPKSKIHNEYTFIQDQKETLIIEKWVLEKNFKWVKK